VEDVVEHVLWTMRQRLDEQLTLDDLAKTARFSKFYFARMFRRVTGVSPRRYLYALRLQEAKRLLVDTSFNVAEISHRVGYQGVGTFTSRFTASVGVPPAAYRRLGGHVSSVLRDEPWDPADVCIVTGRIEEPEGGAIGGPTLVGLFRGALLEGRPVRCDVLGLPGEWSLHHVPTGCWYVLGVSLPMEGSSARTPELPMISVCGPVRVGPDRPTAQVTVRMRPMRVVDPPLVAAMAGPPRGPVPRQRLSWAGGPCVGMLAATRAGAPR
jgi:AraC-like DNA-binding protein